MSYLHNCRKHPWLDDSGEDDVAIAQMAIVEKSCKGTKPGILPSYDKSEAEVASDLSVFKGIKEYCQTSGFDQTTGCISQTVKTDGTPTRLVFGKFKNKFLKRDMGDFTHCTNIYCYEMQIFNHYRNESGNKNESHSRDILQITIQRSGTARKESIISILILMSLPYLYTKIF